MLSYDTEATGLDYWHGCLPYFFAFTHNEGINEWYEWDVDPFTRLPRINQQELDKVVDLLCNNPLILHNANFDIEITNKIIAHANKDYHLNWNWENIEDTCIASHVLENLWPHSLKELRSVFLLLPHTKQDALRQATNHARRIVRTKRFIETHGEWRIADSNDPHWPAVSKAPKEKIEDISGWWVQDMWLPRAIAIQAPEFLPKEENHDQNRNATRRHRQSNPKSIQTTRGPLPSNSRSGSKQKTNPQLHQPNPPHSWLTVLRDYALEDSESTLALWYALEQALKDEDLWEQYLERKQLIEVTNAMERIGVSTTPQIHTDNERYLSVAKENETQAISIAKKLTKGLARTDIPPKDSIFVFGSNREGRHGAGSALPAKTHYGAIYGQAEGLQGNSYAIITKELRRNKPPVKLPEIKKGVGKFLRFAKSNPHLTFRVVEIGCMLAGFNRSQIAPLFKNSPSNVYLPKGFIKELETNHKQPPAEINIRSDKQLQDLLFNKLGCPVLKRTETKAPSVAADVLKSLYQSEWDGKTEDIDTLLQNVLLSRNNEKAATALTSYRQWCLDGTIHSSANITGTKFTRQSFSNPNLQNICTGKELEDKTIDYNLREDFGPRQWWKWLAYDYSNIELRIWGYECGNKEFISCFENDIPVHYLIACELHPELNQLDIEEVKETKAYKRTKNGNFAIIYGASPTKANATYGVPGAYEILSKRFPEVRKFTEKLFAEVAKRGYIETLTGYRLHIPYDDPHKSVSGKVQGTAGAIIGRAMVATHNAFKAKPQFATNLVLQIHDELVFETPIKTKHDATIKQIIFHEMEKQGEAISIPLPVGAKEHLSNWSEGTPITKV